jgi:hypothetical protein
MTEPIIHIVKRPMYTIFVVVDIENNDIDIDIQLTAKGKRYAGARARGYHHFMKSDDEAMAEIIHARDNYFPVPRPAIHPKFSFDQ